MRVKATRRFFDKAAGATRREGDVFDASEERFDEIEAKLPGYVEAVEAESEDCAGEEEAETDELSGLTTANTKREIKEWADARGIEVDVTLTKAQMIEAVDAALNCAE